MHQGASAGMKCEFYDKCSYADPESAMCTLDGGGKYCGKYRLLKSGQLAQPIISEHASDKQPSEQPSRSTFC